MQAAYYNLGLVLVAENRSDEAKAAFRRAVDSSIPNTPFGQAALERSEVAWARGADPATWT